MATAPPAKPKLLSLKEVVNTIDQVLSAIRVPNLPYPIGKLSPEDISDWGPLLLSCWNEQRDESVTHVIQSVDLNWSVRQVNSAYVADRVMDVFLNTSGLHPELARRIARLRFFFAWRLNEEGAKVLNKTFLVWLDSLKEFQGWSDTGGRSSRQLLDQLESLVLSVASAFETGDTQPLLDFCEGWVGDLEKRRDQVEKLRRRLLSTEQGAAKQRQCDRAARAIVGKLLSGRELPRPIIDFIYQQWLSLLKQVVWNNGVDSELWRHACRLLEWLVWVGDPVLSTENPQKLYAVGEKLEEHLADVWQRSTGQPLSPNLIAGVQSVMVAKLKGETPETLPALPEDGRFSWSKRWLNLKSADKNQVEKARGRWFVEGKGSQEQRRLFYAFLEETQEVLWTNGAGVKLGITPWEEFIELASGGTLRPLPPLKSFGRVLAETVTALSKVLAKQKQQRLLAAKQAEKRAAELKQRKADQQAEADRQEAANEQADAEARARAQQHRAEQRKASIGELLDELEQGSWISRVDADGTEQKLKLAIRLKSTGKLVFVDRHGLNRTELRREQLVSEIADGKAQVLSNGGHANDSKTRVIRGSR